MTATDPVRALPGAGVASPEGTSTQGTSTQDTSTEEKQW